MSRWLHYVQQEQEKLIKEAEMNKVILEEKDMPNYECPVCREPLVHHEEWSNRDDCNQKSDDQVYTYFCG